MHGPHAITHAHYRDGVDDHLDHLELIINPQALAEAWRQHGEAVIAEATRRQLPRPLWVERELGLVERRRR
jgi:hypothetical protein